MEITADQTRLWDTALFKHHNRNPSVADRCCLHIVIPTIFFGKIGSVQDNINRMKQERNPCFSELHVLDIHKCCICRRICSNENVRFGLRILVRKYDICYSKETFILKSVTALICDACNSRKFVCVTRGPEAREFPSFGPDEIIIFSVMPMMTEICFIFEEKAKDITIDPAFFCEKQDAKYFVFKILQKCIDSQREIMYRMQKIIPSFCAFCLKNEGKMLRCTGCNRVRYCSIECSKNNWNKHRIDCKKFSDQKSIFLYEEKQWLFASVQ